MSLPNRSLSILLIISILFTLVPAQPVRAASMEDESMEQAFLLMITANTRLIQDSSQFPDNSFASTGHNALVMYQVARKQVNEQRLLAQYYLDLAKKLPIDSKQAKTFLSKAYAHNEMADVLQRRRDRTNNPFQKIGRAITSPFKFIAREVMKLIRQGIRLLEEVGPEIIYDMIEGYLTTGTPINAKIFFHKFKDIAMERIRNSLTNKAIAVVIGAPSGPSASRPKITVTVSKLMQTMTARAAPATETVNTEEVPTEEIETEGGPKKYGTHTISIGLEDVDDWAIDSLKYFAPMISARTECGYTSFGVYELEKFMMPIKVDLEKGTFTAQISGSGSDYLEATEITIPAWEFSSKFTGEITDGAIRPKDDKTGWLLDGTVQIKVVPDGKKRCMHYPLGFPDVPAEYIWLKPDKALILEHAFHGEIDQQKGIKDKKPIITPGGNLTFDIGLAEAEENSGDYFVMQVTDAKIPSAFPHP
jgi:hypothetical protein